MKKNIIAICGVLMSLLFYVNAAVAHSEAQSYLSNVRDAAYFWVARDQKLLNQMPDYNNLAF